MIGLVACCKTKLNGAAPARIFYTSRLFKASLDYARMTCTAVYVASARYGLVELDDVLEPYDLTLATMHARDKELWGARVATQLARRHGDELAAGVQLCILAGAAYAEPLVESYRSVYSPKLDVIEPLAKLQIGDRYAWLQYAKAYLNLENRADLEQAAGGSR